MDEDGRANWYFEYPVINEKYSAFFLNNNSSRFRKAPSFNYTGDWKESLRRRPE